MVVPLSLMRDRTFLSLTLLPLCFANGGCFLFGYEVEAQVVPFDASEPPGSDASEPDEDGALSGPDGGGGLDGAEGGLDDAEGGLDDGGALDRDASDGAPWWIGRDPDETCGSGGDCTYSCGQQPCVFDCIGASNCDVSCGSACRAECTGASNCNLSCESQVGDCSLGCLSTSNCESHCETGSTCDIECGGSNCRLRCETDANCTIDCRRGDNCEEITCEAGAQCLVYCGQSSCNIECDGNGESCPGGIEVCNRDCP